MTTQSTLTYIETRLNALPLIVQPIASLILEAIADYFKDAAPLLEEQTQEQPMLATLSRKGQRAYKMYQYLTELLPYLEVLAELAEVDYVLSIGEEELKALPHRTKHRRAIRQLYTKRWWILRMKRAKVCHL